MIKITLINLELTKIIFQFGEDKKYTKTNPSHSNKPIRGQKQFNLVQTLQDRKAL